MKTLVIFDFDDTLFESETQVIVKSPSRGVRYLSSGEYASFRPEEEDQLDFSQFEAYPTSPKPILKSVNRMRQAVSKYGLDNVIILTARSKNQPVQEVLKDFGLPQVFVAAVGSSASGTKADYVIKTIEEEGYEQVILFEDNVSNIEAIRNAVVPMLGSKNFRAYNVRQEDAGHVLVRH